MQSMTKIAVVNQKGGVGKTTVSVNLAYGIALAGKRVLLVDMDMQAHSSVIYCDDLPEGPEGTVAALLLNRSCPIRDVIRPALVEGRPQPNLSIIPSNIHLGVIGEQIGSKTYREKLLHNHLKEVEGDYDFVVIDCPPSMGVLMVNALYTADQVLIPTNYGRYALDGIADLFGTIEEVKEGDRSCFRILRNAFEARNKRTNQYIESQLDPFRDHIVEAVIRKTEAINQAQIEGLPVSVFAPGSNGATDFNDLTNEFLSYEK